MYSQILNDMINTLKINEIAINCNDIKCSIHSYCIHQLFDETINALSTATEITIPKIDNSTKRPVP